MDKGKEVEKKLSAKVIETEKEQRHVMQPIETPSPEQTALQQAWLKP